MTLIVTLCPILAARHKITIVWYQIILALYHILLSDSSLVSEGQIRYRGLESDNRGPASDDRDIRYQIMEAQYQVIAAQYQISEILNQHRPNV